jgi:hypothetical protein
MRKRIIVVLVMAVAAVTLLATGAVGKSGQNNQGQSHATGPAVTQTRALFAVLTGRKEIDPITGKRGAGDPDGRGTFSAIIDGTQLCFGVTVKNLDTPVAAHIHKARANKNGDIVVPLIPPAVPPASGDPGAFSGCTTIAADLATAILKNPHKYYANVHTATFPGGAARGQLFGRTR